MIVKPQTSDLIFSLTDLQALADYVKFRLFATVAEPADEASAWNLGVRQFVGKLTTLQYIPAAIDFWDSRLAAKTTTGTNEVVTYRDQREGLFKLYDTLTKEVAQDSIDLGFTFNVHGLLPAVSYGDNGRGILLTPDPMDYPTMDSDAVLVPDLWWRIDP